MEILCGTDFTQGAAEAAEVAAAFAARTDRPLVLVHALNQGEAEAALEKLHAEAERLRQLFPGIDVGSRLESGVADEVLTGLARPSTGPRADGKRFVWLIVISSLGRRAPERWVLGSVAERTCQTSPVPVILVRRAKPFISWLKGERSLRVLVGYDFSRTGEAALRWVRELGRLAPCDIVVGHVTWPPTKRRRQGAHRTASAHKNSQIETLLLTDLGARLKEYPWPKGRPSIRLQLSSGVRAFRLAELAAEEKADLLVVGSRQIHGPGRLWQESVSRGALYHAAMSVACVPVVVAQRYKAPPPETPSGTEDEDLVRRLEAHPFLRGVSGEVLRKLATISREERFESPALMLREGEAADTMFLLESGSVALEIDVPGKGPARLESLRAGEMVGLSWLFSPYRWNLDARVVEPATVLAVDARVLREWMNEDVVLGHAVAMRLLGRLYERLERVRLQRLDLYKAEP